MPLYNAQDMLELTLPPLTTLLHAGDIKELLIVDDGSTDDSRAVAARHGSKLFDTGARQGPAAARNLGAEHATGDLLWFVDSDVVVASGAQPAVLRAFDAPEVVAMFGSYDDTPGAENFLSQYKNLVHHYYHQQAKPEASTFWSGCGAVRRSVFVAAGGFDARQYPFPSVEDIELGYRLLEAGGRIRFSADLVCRHLKDWRLRNLLHTEIFRRAVPWARLMLQRGKLTNDLNVGFSERLRALLAMGAVAAALAAVTGLVSWWPVLPVVLAVIWANRGLARLFYRRKGLLFAIGGIAFHQFYYLYSSATFVAVWIEYKLKRR